MFFQDITYLQQSDDIFVIDISCWNNFKKDKETFLHGMLRFIKLRFKIQILFIELILHVMSNWTKPHLYEDP